MKNILIIGSEGYIGSRLMVELSNNQVGVENLAGCDRTRTVGRNLKYNFDYDDLTTEELDKYNYIILLAGNSSVASCEDDFYSMYNNNVTKFINLLEKLKKINNPNKTVIYASSASVYGKQPLDSMDMLNVESRLSEPITNYDFSKQTIERVAKAYSTKFKIIGLRFGTVCGPSPNMRWDTIINSMTKSAWITNQVIYSSGYNARAILDIGTLCNTIVTIIYESNISSGIINVFDFNATIKEIAEITAKNFKSCTLNNSLQLLRSEEDTSIYSFRLATSMPWTFCPSASYEVKIRSIVKGLIDKLYEEEIMQLGKVL